MKKLNTLLAVLLLFVAAQVSGMTVHISGTVTSDSNGTPIPNHEVTVFADSSDPSGFIYSNTVHTNQSGFYEVNIENVPTNGIFSTFFVRTFDCMNLLHQETVYSDTTFHTVNFVICPPGPQDCDAEFTATPDSNNNLTWHFFDVSTFTGSITSRVWTFGDGSGATGNIDPHHTYAQAGVYHVCLTITTSTGCTSDHCQEIMVGSNGGGCQAYFTYEEDSLNTELSYHFFNQSTGNPTSLLWNFGDPASGIHNTATTGDPHHTFSGPGVYNVCLTITGDSCQSTWCDSIEVGNNQVNCASHFSWERTFLTVAFQGHTEDPYPMTYTWHMGDSAQTILTGQNVTFTYPHNGSYTVTLVTVDSTGCTYESHQTIWVSSTCDIWGMVIIENSFADHGTVQLLKMENGVITVIDTKQIQDSSGMYQFGIIGPGDYYLKAELSPNSIYYGQYVPTYFEHSATFAEADLIHLGEVQNPYNIHMVHIGSLAPGQGTINGIITQGNKMNGKGSPVPNVEVMIMDQNNLPLGFTFTDANGQFSFADIAFGSYTIYPDQAGMLTMPAHVTLDGTHTVLNLPFTMTGSNIVFGINDNLPSGISRISEVFPNPAKDNTNITIVAVKDVTVTIALFNPVGQNISTTVHFLIKGENRIQLNLENLNSGSCFIRITSAEGGSVVKKVNIY